MEIASLSLSKILEKQCSFSNNFSLKSLTSILSVLSESLLRLLFLLFVLVSFLSFLILIILEFEFSSLFFEEYIF